MLTTLIVSTTGVFMLCKYANILRNKTCKMRFNLTYQFLFRHLPFLGVSADFGAQCIRGADISDTADFPTTSHRTECEGAQLTSFDLLFENTS